MFPLVGFSLDFGQIFGVSCLLCTVISIFLYLNDNFLKNNEEKLRRTLTCSQVINHYNKFSIALEFQHTLHHMKHPEAFCKLFMSNLEANTPSL